MLYFFISLFNHFTYLFFHCYFCIFHRSEDQCRVAEKIFGIFETHEKIRRLFWCVYVFVCNNSISLLYPIFLITTLDSYSLFQIFTMTEIIFLLLFLAVTSSRNIARCSSSVPSVRAVSRSRSADPSRRSLGQSRMKSGNTHVRLYIYNLTF